MILDRVYKTILVVITIVFIGVLFSDVFTFGVHVTKLLITEEPKFLWSSLGFQTFKIMLDVITAGLLIFLCRRFTSFDQFMGDS